ncbi:hypothetical protein [Gramella sp. MAR_2010_147]|uniref:hypothetical protein n=1 Tax=Gramella sp. MAR_2010_147 TaxID=1250205 RepID=UPI000879CABE|nr:hypothetical protein [Gramella sp. MAR_2010_147]SDR89931.1 hypothetical protein SAMN04488553_0981 [Gramella sp. MAR_2010_147]
MKNFWFIFFIAFMIISCSDVKKHDDKVRYTQNSEEINTMKAAFDDYEKSNWNAMKKHYADTAQIFHNSKDGKKIDEIVQSHKEELSALSSYGFVDAEDEYEMVLTDNGDTWVNFWGDWQATLSGSNEEVTIPIHLTAQFIDGKIVREHAYWDNAIMMMAMQQIDTNSAKQDSISAPSN